MHRKLSVFLTIMSFIIASCATPANRSDILPTTALKPTVTSSTPATSPVPFPTITPLSINISSIIDKNTPQTVHFSSRVSGGTPPYSLSWDFDDRDGIQIDKLQADPGWVYGSAGEYTASVQVRDSAGQKAAGSVKINIPQHGYKPTAEVRLNNVHGTASKPIIIENLDLSPAKNNGISLINCSYIIIRNNHIHDIQKDEINNGTHGLGIYVQDSSHIEIAGNLVENNTRGIWANATPGSPPIEEIHIHDNLVKGSRLDYGIHVTTGVNIELDNNLVLDNGDKTYFDRHRISGIIAWNSTHVSIHDNYSAGSSSDGIGIATSIEYRKANPEFSSSDISVYRNTSKDNSEQGIWLNIVKNGNIHDNYITGNHNEAEALGSSGIMMEGEVDHMDIYQNILVDNEVSEININSSSDNTIHDNYIRSTTAGWAGIWINQFKQDYFREEIPAHNIIRSNIFEHCSLGIALSAGAGTTIANNIFYANGGGHNNAGGILILPGVTGTLITRNILAGQHGTAVMDQSGTSIISFNDFFQNTSDMAGVQSADSNFYLDPLFVDIKSGNFSLQNSSPLIYQGSTLPSICTEKSREIGPFCSKNAFTFAPIP